MKKLLDLRFVIGLFFLLIGSLLLIFQFLVNKGDDQGTASPNFWSGISFVLFGTTMIGISYTGKIGDAEE